MKINGDICLDQSLIVDHVVSCYEDLYSSRGVEGNYDDLLDPIPSLVTVADNEYLTAVPTADEVKAAVFSLDPSSAPAPDGYTGVFFTFFLDIVGSDVVLFVQSFFRNGYLPPNTNSNFMVLISKISGANEITHFRPITLANFVFKIIPKILVDRLGAFEDRIFSPQQRGFVKGRTITDPIGLVLEGFNLLDSKVLGGNLGLKNDIRKAFDTVEWPFLLKVLQKFGFSDNFIAWISTILHSARLSIMINGTPKVSLVALVGSDKGILCLRCFFVLLRRSFLAYLLLDRFFPFQCRIVVILPLIHYMRMTFLFFFVEMSGPFGISWISFIIIASLQGKLSVGKNVLFIVLRRTYLHRRTYLRQLLGFIEGSAPFLYLGVPIFRGRPTREFLQILVDKVRSRLEGWCGKLLSMAGHVQLVCDVVGSMMLHSFRIYQWPAVLLRKLSGWIQNFIWTGSCDSRKLVSISWSQMCLPRECVGLGLRNLLTLNRAALCLEYFY